MKSKTEISVYVSTEAFLLLLRFRLPMISAPLDSDSPPHPFRQTDWTEFQFQVFLFGVSEIFTRIGVCILIGRWGDPN